MKISEVSIVKYSSVHKQAALELLAHLWTHLSREDQKDLFAWRYEKNPYSDSPCIYLALTGNTIIALRAFVMQPFIHPETGRLLTITPADTIVHPDYRGKGIFRALNDAFLKEVSSDFKEQAIIINLSSNEESTPANIKQDWQATNGIKRFALKFSLSAYLTTKFFGQGTKVPGSAVSNKHLFELTDSPRPEEMAKCAKSYRNPHKLSHVRDAEYFKWRYAINKDKYIFAYLWQDDELLTYLVIEKRYGMQYLLVEYAFSDVKTLKKTISLAIKNQRIPFLRTWVLSNDDSVLLKKCGFMPAPVKLWNMLGKTRLPVLVRPVKEHPVANDFFLGHLDARDINNWQFFIADRH